MTIPVADHPGRRRTKDLLRHAAAALGICALVYSASVGSALAEYSFAHSYAVVVGIDDYADQGHYPHLNNAVRDAEEFARYIRSQGFDVVLLRNSEATRTNILANLVDKIVYDKKAGQDSRLVFFFGGHGRTRYSGIDGSVQYGFIVPYDGADSNASLISMDDLHQAADVLRPVRHVLFVLNSCFGGSIARGLEVDVDPSVPNYIEAIVTRPAKEFMTAGGANEVVADGGPANLSPYMEALLRGLRGQADTNNDGTVTFAELAAWMSRAGATLHQHPGYGTLAGHGAGEFVFRSGPAPIASGVPTSPLPEKNVVMRSNLTSDENARLARRLTFFDTPRKPYSFDAAEGRSYVDGLYFTFVGSHLSPGDAWRQAASIERNHPDIATTVYRSLRGAGYYGVAVAGFTTQDRALQARDLARQLGIAKDAYIWTGRMYLN